MDPLAALAALSGMADPNALAGGFSPTGLGAAANRVGGLQPGAPMDPLTQQYNLNQYLIGYLMGLMLGRMAQQNGGMQGLNNTGGVPGVGGADGSAGGFPNPAVGGSGGGASPTGGGASPAGGTDTSSVPGGTVGASGNDSVDLARKYLGQNSIDIKGKLPHFTAAGGQTNNCADFVSSVLESTGRLQGHHVNVKEMEQALIKQGWRQVAAAQAKPGDVWMSSARSHVELVTAAGGTRTIGSNNDRPGHQVISERAKSPGSGVYYSKG